jgi:hypothetical protein
VRQQWIGLELSIEHPEAAAWWGDNAPQMMSTAFILDESACKPL